MASLKNSKGVPGGGKSVAPGGASKGGPRFSGDKSILRGFPSPKSPYKS